MEKRQPLALITGGSQGIGFEVARKLGQQNFRVIITSRNQEQATRAARLLNKHLPEPNIQGLALNLASLTSVQNFALLLRNQEPALQVLIANAVHWPKGKLPLFSEDGFELTFATNHLGHFLLVNALQPLLEQGAIEAGEARVVVVSSRLHKPNTFGAKTHFDFDNPDLRYNYHPLVAYKNSKLTNLWFAYELGHRLTGTGVSVNAVCPGFVPQTEAERSRGFKRLFFKYVMPFMPFANSLEQASTTYIFAATDPSLKGVSGKFYGESREIQSSTESYDKDKAARLWEISLNFISHSLSPYI